MEFQHSNIPVFYDSIIPLLQHSSLRFRLSIFEFRISTPKSLFFLYWTKVQYTSMMDPCMVLSKFVLIRRRGIWIRFEQFRDSLYSF